MGKNRYVHGDHNVICDQTGRKVKRSQCEKTWEGNIVIKGYGEVTRHPQDFLRGGRPSKGVPDSRPEPTDNFLDPGEADLTL